MLSFESFDRYDSKEEKKLFLSPETKQSNEKAIFLGRKKVDEIHKKEQEERKLFLNKELNNIEKMFDGPEQVNSPQELYNLLSKVNGEKYYNDLVRFVNSGSIFIDELENKVFFESAGNKYLILFNGTKTDVYNKLVNRKLGI